MSAVSLSDIRIYLTEDQQTTLGALEPVFESGKVDSRGDAFPTYSSVLKLTQGLFGNEKALGVWKTILAGLSFRIGDEEQQYNFNAILGLIGTGERTFQVTWKKAKIEDATAIDSIAKGALGRGPGVDLMEKRLSQSNVVAYIGSVGDTPVVAAYGTYVSALNLVHVNFAGRRFDYPGIYALQALQKQRETIMEQYPSLALITLKVQVKNTHMIEMYENLGFEKIGTIQGEFQGDDVHLYAYRIKEGVELPTKDAFQEAYKIASQ